MIRAVVKHSYIKGSKGHARARAHVNYLQYRKGDDRERSAREFFSADREQVFGRTVKERISEQDRYGVQVHKLILSPGINGINIEQYTRESMESLGKRNGLDLEWYAVKHTNTDHDHVHVVVMGRDRDGRQVRIDRNDHKLLREVGDRYLERHHQLDRYVDREIERLLERGDRMREVDYKRDRGDREFDRLMYGDDDERRKRHRQSERDSREFERLDRDLHKIFDRPDRLDRPLTYKQFQREAAGRLLDFHEQYQNQAARDRWKELLEKQPELADQISQELAFISALERESKVERSFGNDDLDRLIDGKECFDRVFDQAVDREFRETTEKHRDQRDDFTHEHDAPSLLDRLVDNGRDDTSRFFERDRQSQRYERDRDDDDNERTRYHRDRGDRFER
jgi:hypothetical protein